MAVCQAPGQRDGRLPGTRPARWPFARQRAAAQATLAKFQELLGRRTLTIPSQVLASRMTTNLGTPPRIGVVFWWSPPVHYRMSRMTQ